MIKSLTTFVAVVVLAIVVAIGYLLSRPDPAFEFASVNFATQINSLGDSLQAGESAKVQISATSADELMLVPCYCPKEALVSLAPHLESKTIDRIVRSAADDHSSAELVWLRNGDILDICQINLQTAVNTAPRLWQVKNGCEILVRKELESPNRFLSLEFPE